MNAQAQGMHIPTGGMPQQMDMGPAGGMQNVNGGFSLPAALLAQYPALQTLQWDQLGNGPGVDEGDLGGRSSFDASSGGDYFEEDEEGGYVSGPGTGFGQPGWGVVGGGQEWTSDYEGR